jgi:hypothetical protein
LFRCNIGLRKGDFSGLQDWAPEEIPGFFLFSEFCNFGKTNALFMKTIKMKSLLFTLIVTIPISLFSQKELTGALGLTFGMDNNSVKKIIAQRGGIIKTGIEGSLSITNISMGTKKPDMVICKFVNNKLFEIGIYFIPTVEAKTQELYDEISGIIASKYGEGQSFRHFSNVYTDGDGYEMQAVKLGYADIVTYWSNFLNKNAIALQIYPLSNNLYIKLIYQDDRLATEVEKQQSIKDKAEF